MTGPAALIALVDFFDESFPGFRAEEFWGFPFFRAFFFPLPANDTREKGNAVGGFWTVAFGLIGPFHATAHGK